MPIVLITGGHTGIGFQCAERLACHHRKDLILAGRSMERMKPAAEKLRSYGVKVWTIQLDTSSMRSVRVASEIVRDILSEHLCGTLQALICNAGVSSSGPVSYSEDGYEKTFATNYLGHFLLTELLCDAIAPKGRILLVVSGTHDPDTMDGKMVGRAAEPDAFALAHDGKDGQKPLAGGRHYSTSKLCMVMMAYELHRRLRKSESHIASIAYDPGAIPETGLIRNLPLPLQAFFRLPPVKWLVAHAGVTTGSLEFSGNRLADIAVEKQYADDSGKYLQSSNGRLIEARSSRVSYDGEKAQQLWDQTKTLVKLTTEEEPQLLS
ncbi:SDR family NAD(P)-dependent oxidoreductase [Luteolibacter pohnpeiensis]|uniref:SDR family NAD(P)-dependent oxidoreductase n=1 Tax=Luteolibacter pohnpeiensis TaxID=454153 RepID=A0A934S7T5_9BACT|nr:SDR family NAD(P)-dependent oxidoreductase [Luteolibacter pohnpeiensis]MBK1883772.1 SDR family NAD(P)-dependent oxidoreductase [Luteolibacter pohnpeiensis]